MKVDAALKKGPTRSKASCCWSGRPLVAQRAGGPAAVPRHRRTPAGRWRSGPGRAHDPLWGARLRWVHTQDVPENFISRYQLVINGRPVRTIGSNLVPPDLYFGRMVDRGLFLFRQAKAAGMNTLRIWGGA